MKTRIRLVAGLVVPVVVAGVALFGPSAQPVAKGPLVKNRVLARQLAYEFGRAKRPQWQQRVSSGAMYTLLQATGILDQRAAAVGGAQLPSGPGTLGCHKVKINRATDVRVNQDCSLRRQAEETIAVNPLNSKNLIAGQNDSRVGFNHCGYDWSLDGGNTWGDQIPPFFQFILGDGHTADACSDPTAAFDSKGNAYAGGIVFDISSVANAILVEKSNAGINGQFYHTPAAIPFQTFLDNPPGVVASDNDPNIFNDKELMTADAHASSPKHDNAYMTWTRFNEDTGQGVGADSPIFFSQSTDGGATWSPGIEISGSSPKFCTAFSGEADPNACDQDQGSHPIVGPDGTVYVAFGNGNTPVAGVNQHLAVACPAAADCTNAASWRGPFKIGDDFGTQPLGPDSDTGCPSGRQCLPPNGYRLDDFVEGSISVADNGRLFFAWADYRNGQDSKNCPGLSQASDDTPPCNNDVFYSFSVDGGKTWSVSTLVTPKGRFGRSAQWQPWSAVSRDGKSLYVAFYDRGYGNCEFTGCNDITLASIRGPASGRPTFTYQRLSNSSMPNLVPANNPAQAGFLGDYMWVTTGSSGAPYVVWASTRGLNSTVEEDIYFAR